MSRIGRAPIEIPAGVEVTCNGNVVTVKGPKGTLLHNVHPDMTVTVEGNTIHVTRPSDDKMHRSLHGLTRTLGNNMITGVTEGYEKKLEIVGVGYRVISKGPQQLEFALGFSHPVIIDAPQGIEFTVETPTRMTVKGIDKQLVGETAANIRKIRKPEPYKGKGVRYAGERVRRKVGKAGK